MLYPLNTEMEPGFGIWEGSGRFFVEAVAERQGHNFIHPTAAGGSSVPCDADSVELLAREENIRRP